MPIITYIPQDPTDLVIQGEQLRMSVFDTVVPQNQSYSLINDGIDNVSVIGDEDAYSPMNSFIEGNPLSARRQRNGALQIRDGAGIVSSSGAWIWLDYSPLILLNKQATSRLVLSGVTRDNTSAVLGNCRVVVLETSKIAVGQMPVIAETTSDGSGNYSIEVLINTSYQEISYKQGSPDVAGITRNDITPSQV